MASRAVTLTILAKEQDQCESCDVKINSDLAKVWVVANVYVVCSDPSDECRTCRGSGEKWDRVEHYHVQCYEEEGSPYGDAPKKTKGRRNA